MNFLGFVDGNIILLIVIAVLLVLYPIFLFMKNKKEQDKQKNLIDNLKVGEYVITYSGVFGKIVEITEKEFGRFLTIETGENHKNYVTVSANAIYMIANNNPKVYDADGNEIKPETKEDVKETVKETSKPAENIETETGSAEENLETPAEETDKKSAKASKKSAKK